MTQTSGIKLESDILLMELSPEARLVLLYVKGQLRNIGKLPHPTNVGKILHLTRERTRDSFKELAFHGLIKGTPDEYTLTDNFTRSSLMTSVLQTKEAEHKVSDYPLISFLEDFKEKHFKICDREPLKNPGELAQARGILKDFSPEVVRTGLAQFFDNGLYRRYLSHQIGHKSHVRLLSFRKFLTTLTPGRADI